MIRSDFFRWSFITFGFLISNIYCMKVEPLSLPYDGYYCYITCYAECIESRKSLDKCQTECQQYNNKTNAPCQTSDSSCWKIACGNSSGNSSISTLGVPNITSVGFADAPEPSPRKAKLEWTRVQDATLYIVQYVESDDAFVTWATGGLDIAIATSNVTTIEKKNLCPEYQFRVAAVNRHGVSVFSDIVTLHKPVPVMLNPRISVNDSVLLQKKYDEPTNTTNWSETVRVTIEFVPPPGWSLTSKEIEPSFLQPFLLNCNKKSSNFPVPKTMYDLNQKPFVYYEFPGFVVEKECTFIITLDQIKSKKCGTSYKYPPNSGILFINFTCTNTRNANCSIIDPRTSATCNYVLSYDFNNTAANESELVPVGISWTHGKPTNEKSNSTSCHIFRIVQTEKSSSPDDILKPKIIRDLGFRNDCRSDWDSNETEPNSIVIKDIFQQGKYYSVQMCSISNHWNEQPIDWNISLHNHLDLFEKFSALSSFNRSERMSTATLVIIIVVICIVTVASIFIAVCIVKNNKKKRLEEMSAGDYHTWSNGRYVDMPRRFDVWEIQRKRLVIYDDVKLGSGAFGAVFKGKVKGQLLNHKDANSALAENWMRAEDSEVAVKMLPDYADDSSKSDFRKEINLMKQLGHHDRLVNMLACITSDEPLCLIVDYCSDGDLLHYMRDRRQYMIKLESVGINFNNLPEESDVDMSMVLCMKDLISFAWQISVGLEYLSQKNFIHRDVAARNILVDKGKKAKIGDFGLCRYSYSDPIYMGKGGRLPIKWMAIEAIKNYEFTTKSDVWSFGVLLFEIITLGGSPYPGIQPSDMQGTLEAGQRMEHPDNCPQELYQMMLDTWHLDPDKRPMFTDLREGLRKMLEDLTTDYYYMSLNTTRDYYNVVYGEDNEAKIYNGQSSSGDTPSSSGSNAKLFSTQASEPESPSSPAGQSQKTVVTKPPVQPRSRKQHYNSDSSSSNSEAGLVNDKVRHSDDSSISSLSNSEKMLITPSDNGKFRFLKFKPSTLDDLQENYANINASNKLAFSNEGYINTASNVDDEL